MKVYVDELPNNCEKCPFHSRTLLFAENHIENAVYKTDCRLGFTCNCRLQSLAEHDKQVRKQVCDEIKKRIKKEYVIFDAEEDRKAFNKILKQIQGENNVKD